MTQPFSCATCVFFSRNPWEYTPGQPNTRGQCRRHAPVLDKDQDGRLRSCWPMVSESAFCGDHAELDEVPPHRIDDGSGGPPAYRWGEGSETGAADPPAGIPLPEWRCANCKEEWHAGDEPDRCPYCNCREVCRVAAS